MQSVGRLSWRLGRVNLMQFSNAPHGVLREAAVAHELLRPSIQFSLEGQFLEKRKVPLCFSSVPPRALWSSLGFLG